MWKIKVNVDKSEAVLFTKKVNINEDHRIIMYGTPIPWTKQARYLGITLDYHLTWRPHIAHIISKFRARKACTHYL
ncbi:hypothetical protein X975_20773, partial [Stegodyphus mimosarum]